jgi:uncharacterized protein (DUF1501 family)
MAITRRQFLTRTGAATALGLARPTLFGGRWVGEALASTFGDRYLVVIYLDGGNDGLNTVTPVTNGGGTLRTDYDTARSNINLTPSQLAATLIGADPNTGAQLALHPGLAGTGPGMGGLKALWDEGKLAVIQGVGYPNYTLSHDDSRIIWETGYPIAVSGFGGTGWMGRFLAHPTQDSGADILGVSVRDRVAGEFKSSGASVLAVRRLEEFGFPYDAFAAGDVAAKRAVFDAIHQHMAATAPPTLSYIGSSGAATLLSAENYPALDSLYETDRPTESQWYSDVAGSVARDLREVAKVMYGVATAQPNVAARFFELTNSGYDSHSGQGGATGYHHDILKEVGDALRVFMEDLRTMPGNLADKTMVVVWSEFSRRIRQNHNGTDHGSQGPMFVVGGTVAGGVYGNHPNIAPSAQDGNGNTVYVQDPVVADPFRSTDFRDVYGTILTKWLNMPEAVVLADVLQPDGGDPAHYWTTPDFDLGFV